MKGNMNNKIIKIANKLLKNDIGFYDYELECFIEDFIEMEEETDFQELLYVLQYIANDGYNMDGFEIYEIPHPNVYIFFNRDKQQMFDVCKGHFCPSNTLVCAAYTSQCVTARNYDLFLTPSISEAIRKYDKELYINA